MLGRKERIRGERGGGERGRWWDGATGKLEFAELPSREQWEHSAPENWKSHSCTIASKIAAFNFYLGFDWLMQPMVRILTHQH